MAVLCRVTFRRIVVKSFDKKHEVTYTQDVPFMKHSMEHISFETARLLTTDAGWTKRTLFCWCTYLHQDTSEYEVWEELTETSEIHLLNCMAPLAEELLEVLPAMFKELPDQRDYNLYILKEGYYTKDTPEYNVYYAQYPESPCYKYQAEHKCLSEALAALLVKLVKQGVVSKEYLTDKK